MNKIGKNLAYLDADVVASMEIIAVAKRATGKCRELRMFHGLSWADLKLLTVLDAGGGVACATVLAGTLHMPASQLLLRLLPLEKTGLVMRAMNADGKRAFVLRSQGRRLLQHAQDTAADDCATLCRMEYQSADDFRPL